MNGTDDDKLIDKRTAAELLAVSRRSIDRLVVKGKLTRVKVLGAVRYRLSELRGIMARGAA